MWKLPLMAAALSLLLCACQASPPPESAEPEEPEEAEGTAVLTAKSPQHVVIQGFDWGPGVVKTVLQFDTDQIDAASITPESFSVVETKEAFDYGAYGAWAGGDESADPSVHITASAPRVVTDAYLCGADFQRAEGAASGSAIALELACSPDSGNPYCFDLLTWHNTVCSPYELAISLTEESALRLLDGTAVTGLEVEAAVDLRIDYSGSGQEPQFDIPQLEGVDLSGVFTGTDGRTLRYASYEPEEAGTPRPLVIWLHGAGEGGEDPSVLLLGNKVTALFGEAFQTALDGAYVLTPQTPDFWLVYNEHGDWQDNPGVPSVYTVTLKELIDAYLAAHPGVDETRIYIGGCSNGGYMAWNMVLSYPDFFAAAFPICEAYLDAGITDDQLAAVREVPLWFVYAENDDTVIPANYEIPTIQRLRDMGANVHTSVFPNVVDTSGLYTGEDGSPYEYAGHWSWLYFFNNECQEDGVNLWQWLSEQSRPEADG